MWSWWIFSWAAARRWRRHWHGASGYSASRTGGLCATAWACAPPSHRLPLAPPPWSTTTAALCPPTPSRSTLGPRGKATKTKPVRRASTLTHAIAVRDHAARVQKPEWWLTRKTPRPPTSGGESAGGLSRLWPPTPFKNTHLQTYAPPPPHTHTHSLFLTNTHMHTHKFPDRLSRRKQARPSLSLFRSLQSFQQSHVLNLQGNCGEACNVMPDCRPQFFFYFLFE